MANLAELRWSTLPPSTTLPYTIYTSSNRSTTYAEDNILTDNPTDIGSRWSGNPNLHNEGSDGDLKDPKGSLRNAKVQFIVLELERPALVTRLGFGKYCKPHTCNLSDFSIYGGMTPNPRYMEPLCHGGLKNDSIKEAFALAGNLDKITDESDAPLLPIKFIRVDALAAVFPNYNVSIWHIWLEGVAEPVVMDRVLAAYEASRTLETNHLVLAHLRRSHLVPAFTTLLSSLPSSTTSTFEHPLLSQLHSALTSGHFPHSESLLSALLSAGLFDQWGAGIKGASVARWTPLPSPGPAARGGHQLVRVGRKLLLFGGYDQGKNFGDLWERELGRGEESVGEWRELEPMGERPGPRSCHQLAVDEGEGWIYLLGGIMDAESDPSPAPPPSNGNGAVAAMEVEVLPVASRSPSHAPNPLLSDFWRYKAAGPGSGTWELISADTSSEGGPKLLFDHQMTIDSATRTLFVFGGKHVAARSSSAADVADVSQYSGLFAYDLVSRSWSHLLGDPTEVDPYRVPRLLSRTGHAMILDSDLRQLFVLSGNRGNDYLSDLWSIKIALPSRRSSSSAEPKVLSTTKLSDNYSKEGGPVAMFTQRATIDAQSGEWTLVSGLMSDSRKNEETTVSEVWTRTRRGHWESVEVRGERPAGRFSSQVVYDPLRKEHYMFGGTPSVEEGTARLADFWRLKIYKSTPETALRRALFLVRKQKFNEMCQTGPTLSALSFLQTSLSMVVDHSDEDEAAAFRACMAALLAAPASEDDDEMDDSDAEEEDMELTPELYAQRHALFEHLLDFFPDGVRQPREDLRDLAGLDRELAGRFG